MVDVIELDEMIVAGEENRAVWMIVHQVVRYAVPDAAHQHSRRVAPRPAGLPLEMTVFREMAAGRERLSVPPAERHAAIAGVEQVATHDAVVRAAGDDHAHIAEVPQQTA